MNLSPKEIKKIGVFRALQLGDMLNVIPAIRALRSAYPNAEIVLIGLPWAVSFVKRFHYYFNRFIHFPGYAGLPEQLFDKAVYESFLQTIKKENFDLLLQMQGNGTIVNNMLLQWNAKNVAGFYNGESFVESPLFIQYPDFGSEIFRHLLLMQQLGLPLQGDELEFPTIKEDEQEWQQLQLKFDLENYVCIHPGSRGAWRQWPPKYFARLADLCADNGYTPVVTGTNDEAEITQNVINRMKCKAVDLTGKTSLGSMALLVKNATCLIANCTGVSHLASATKTPSIVISMDGEPERWSPLDTAIHWVTDWTKTDDFSVPFEQLISFFLSQEMKKKIIF